MKVPVRHLIVAAACSLPAVGQQPTVSDSIDLPQGARVLLQAKGDGVQNYVCSEDPAGTKTPAGMKWTLKGPEARLLDASKRPIGTHFAGPTWKLNDGSQVQGVLKGKTWPDKGSIEWLRLDAKEGTATGSLASVAFIRRTDTHGGLAPTTGCRAPKDASKTVSVPYTATYTFYAEK
jgi:hypothetical protein